MVAFGSPGQRPPRSQWSGLAVSLVLGVGGHTSESALLFLSRHHTAAVLFPLLGLTAGIWVERTRVPGLGSLCLLRMRQLSVAPGVLSGRGAASQACA